MFEIRAAGALLAAVFSALMGFALGNDLKRRAALLRELYKGVVMMHQEVDYLKVPLEEAMQHAGTILTEPLSSFFQETGSRLERLPGTPFFSVWEESAGLWLKDSGLMQEDRELLLQLGRQLASPETLERGVFLTVYERRLEELIQKAEKEYQNKAQLYGRLGVLGGIFLVIVLI